MNFDKIISLLMVDEGYVKYPYLDTEGNITIGIGNNLSAKGLTLEDANKVYPNGISIEAAKEDATKTINAFIDKFKQQFPLFFDLTEPRQYVIINMTYQNGLKGLYGFKDMIMFLKNKDYKNASYAITNSLDARKFKERYKRLSEIMLTGNWLS